MTKDSRLLNEDIPLLMKQIAIPASTGLLFNTMYNVVDTFYAGLISTTAIASVALSFMIFFSIIGLGQGLASGITALIGNALGKKKYKLASFYSHKALLFIPFISLFLTIPIFLYSDSLFTLLGAKDDYLSSAISYINPILIGSVFLMLNLALNTILVASGDTKTYRNSLIFGFFANLLLNPLFIYGFYFIPAFEIEGIAIATVLIYIINSFYLFYKVLQTKLIKLDQINYFLANKRIYLQFLKQGLPSSLNMLTMALGSIILTYFVSHYGLNAVAGFAIAFKIEQVLLLPALGINLAVLTLISNNYGAKKYDRIHETLSTAFKYGFVIASIGMLILFVFGEILISLFDSKQNVIEFALKYLYIEIWVFYAYVILVICIATLQAIKKPKMIFYIGIYRQIFAKVLVSFLIVKYFSLDFKYLWIGILFMIYSAAIFAYFYTSSKLKKLLV